MLTQYILDDYDKINAVDIEYSLNEDTHQQFNILYKLVEEYIATLPPPSQNEYTQYDKKKHRKQYKNYRKNDNHDGNNNGPFKATKLEKREGIEEKYSVLRSTLNKITLKNYESLIAIITEIVNSVMGEGEDDSDDEDAENVDNDSYMNIANIVLDIVKKVGAGHEVYVLVFKDMIKLYPSFITQITEFVTKYNNSFNDIIDIDANQHYDAYCELVKANDYRRSNSKFVVKLTEYNLLEQDELLGMIEGLFDKVLTNIDKEKQTVLIEEVTENIFIFMVNSFSFLHHLPRWSNLIERLNQCSKLKAKDHQSISSRIVFKYMDIQDALKKLELKSN